MNSKRIDKIKLYKRIDEMRIEEKEWVEIADELNVPESYAVRLYLEGVTGVLFRAPKMCEAVAEVVLHDLERQGRIMLYNGIGKKYHVSECEFDEVLYILELYHGCKRIVKERDGKKTAILVRGNENE